MPYVGVTGFTKYEQVESAMASLPQNPCRHVMVGVLASYKSLREIPMKPKWQEQMPPPETIENIFWGEDFRQLNLVHYSSSAGCESTIAEDLARVMGEVGLGFDGFQLNVSWPDVHALDRYRRNGNGRRQLRLDAPWMVLQIGNRAVEEAGGSPNGVVAKLRDYIHVVDGILLDPSGGLGIPLDPEGARPFLTAIAEQGWELELGVAGGLGPNTLHLVEPLIGQFPKLNIDAQGCLRNERNELDSDAVRTYLSNALSLFSSVS